MRLRKRLSNFQGLIACCDSVPIYLADGQKTGMAKETFYVNSGPINGDCEVAPLSGEEFRTEFKVFCREWQDKVRPHRVLM